MNKKCILPKIDKSKYFSCNKKESEKNDYLAYEDDNNYFQPYYQFNYDDRKKKSRESLIKIQKSYDSAIKNKNRNRNRVINSSIKRYKYYDSENNQSSDNSPLRNETNENENARKNSRNMNIGKYNEGNYKYDESSYDNENQEIRDMNNNKIIKKKFNN